MPDTDSAGLKPWQWWFVFIAASVSLSWFFEAFKSFTLMSSLRSGLQLIGCALLLATSFLVLVYDAYVKEKIKGTLARTFAPFEWWYNRRQS
ncbi:MAG: hypothetical protein VKK59_04540 [Vampirovibrionales bacterium]|nr:hypothetical protein [Vampirovibrionales bacterium]